MPILLLLVAAAGGAFLLVKGSSGSMPSSGDNVIMVGGYPDVSPENQGGVWKIDYDSVFQAASMKTGVPFALIKAHAIRESSLDPRASRNEPPTSSRPPSASYGLTQILWWKNSNRFSRYGYSDDDIGDGSLLYDTSVNTIIGASIMSDNLKRFKNLRDAINAYNTGVGEATRKAPGDYVDQVLGYYSTLVGKDVS